MMRSARHVRTSSSWSRSARTAIALTLALVACLLVLPATASANVDKKHAKAYAAKVKFFSGLEEAHRDSYNGYLDVLVEIANDMKPLIGSPDPYDQASLAALKAVAKQDYDLYQSDLRPGNRVYLDSVNAFYPACKGWFSKPADKIKFHRWVKRLALGIALSNKAYAKLALGFLCLSEEDMPTAQTHNNDAIKLITQAEPYIDEGFAGLRKLRR